MAFPISPSNNQIALVNGIEYYYNTSKGAWYRYGDATANVITANTFQVLSSIVFSDGTSQTTAPTNIDSYARNTANTATNNITILQGVDATQNTNITTATNAAQAAFAQANATAGGLISANSRLTIVEGVDVGQNTRMTIIEGVDVGQNTRMSIIEGVDTTQNTRITIVEGVDVGQNSRMTIIEGVDTWQNTQITAISSLAQGAFARANSGARATSSNTTPTGNTVGDLWLSLTDETLYIYSYDGTSNNWIDISGPILISTNIVVQYTITANVV
jgi:flagellar biogenesis protein FliO